MNEPIYLQFVVHSKLLVDGRGNRRRCAVIENTGGSGRKSSMNHMREVGDTQFVDKNNMN